MLVAVVAVSSPSHIASRGASSHARPEARGPALTGRLRAWVRRRRIIAGTPTRTRTRTPASASPMNAVTSRPSVFLCPDTGRVDDETEDEDEDDGEEPCAPVSAASAVAEPAAVRKVGIPSFTLAGQGEAVLDAARALEDVRVIRGRVAFADDVGAAELELLGKRRRAAPLNVLVAVGRALVGAAQHVDVVEVADATGRDAPELRDGGDTAMRRLGAIAAEGERLYVGEEDGILGARGDGQHREGEVEGQCGGDHGCGVVAEGDDVV